MIDPKARDIGIYELEIDTNLGLHGFDKAIDIIK